jgi:hypothetical protein
MVNSSSVNFKVTGFDLLQKVLSYFAHMACSCAVDLVVFVVIEIYATGVTMSTGKNLVKFVILGEPASKANMRQLVKFGNRPAIIKSKKALNYVSAFSLQCPQMVPPIEKDIAVWMRIYYSSRRPDLDEAVVLDAMQSVVRNVKDPKTKKIIERIVVRNNVYKNDRQVKEKHIFWGLDKENPRVEIAIREWDEEAAAAAW